MRSLCRRKKLLCPENQSQRHVRYFGLQLKPLLRTFELKFSLIIIPIVGTIKSLIRHFCRLPIKIIHCQMVFFCYTTNGSMFTFAAIMPIVSGFSHHWYLASAAALNQQLPTDHCCHVSYRVSHSFLPPPPPLAIRQRLVAESRNRLPTNNLTRKT